MDEARIRERMNELSKKISYSFKDIKYLSDAMCSKKLAKYDGVGKHYKELTNEALAQVGDSILSFLLADHLYRCSEEIKRDGIRRKGKMNAAKERRENNDFLHRIEEQEGLIEFAYHDTHFHTDADIEDDQKVSDGAHSPYLEAIIAAIYYDGGFEAVQAWFEEWLLPLIEKHQQSGNGSHV